MKLMLISAANSIHTVRWVNAMIVRMDEVLLVSLKDHYNDIGNINGRVKVVYLPVVGGKGYFLNARALRTIVRGYAPDVVNVHYASGYGTLARISKIGRTVLSVWGSDVYEFPYKSIINRYIIKRNLIYATRIASTSRNMATQVRHLIGKEVDITITPFGVECNDFCMTNNKNPKCFNVGIIKALSPNYGIDYIIRAFDIFYKRIDWKNSETYTESILHIYGSGRELENLKMLANELGIFDKIVFYGSIDNKDVPLVLSRLDVFCLGSRSESFGVAAIEAMAAGLPVIATDAPGFVEIIESGKDGYIVSKDNPEEMANYLIYLLDNENSRNILGVRAKEKVQKNYNWNDNVKTMIDLYKEVVE